MSLATTSSETQVSQCARRLLAGEELTGAATMAGAVSGKALRAARDRLAVEGYPLVSREEVVREYPRAVVTWWRIDDSHESASMTMRRRLLAGEVLDRAAVAAELGINPSLVSTVARQLRDEGYEVEARNGHVHLVGLAEISAPEPEPSRDSPPSVPSATNGSSGAEPNLKGPADVLAALPPLCTTVTVTMHAVRADDGLVEVRLQNGDMAWELTVVRVERKGK